MHSISGPDSGRRPERAPALPLLGAFAGGIALEQGFDLDGWTALIAAAAAFLLGCLCRTVPLRVVALLVGWLCLGAAAYDRVSDSGSVAEITQFAQPRRLTRLRAEVIEPPVIERIPTPFWSRTPSRSRTRCRLGEIRVADEAGRWHPIGGRVEFLLRGELPALRLGDAIETLGWLEVPGPARNPGGFDTRAWDRRRGVDARLYTDLAQTVHVTSHEPNFSFASLIAGLRHYLGQCLERLLSRENAAIGRAMLLGDRSAMSDDIRNAYQITGAMHVIAISGMHIAVLAAALIVGARLFRVSPAIRAGGIITVIWVYAALVGMEPPVTRAALFLTLWAVGLWLERPICSLNTIALAALVLLAWDPRTLFDMGARLSFLAVLGIAWAARLAPALTGLSRREPFADPSPLRRIVNRFWRSVLLLELVALAIWLFNGPLMARDFGRIAPISLPLNLVLVPLSTLVLWAGFLLLAVCWLPPAIAGGPAALFGGGLWLMNRLVEGAADIPGGHLVAVAPPGWWLGVWYLLLMTSLIWLRRTRHRLRPLVPLVIWGLVGFAALPSPEKEEGLRLTVLDVGHGGAILIEAPNGKTLLYDCGSMSGGRSPARAVWDCLRLRGHRDLDILVLSHPDLDHCNGVGALLEIGSVGEMCVARSFLDFSQQCVVDATRAAREAGVPLHRLAAGDHFQLAPTVQVNVLHPANRPGGIRDNANSLVLEINIKNKNAGRRILLTGDLEGAGLAQLLASHRPRRCDILLAPHHGGDSANPPVLGRWARPRILLISTGDRPDWNRLQRTYPTADRFHATSEGGAITVHVRPDGAIAVTEQLAEAQ